MPDKKAASKNNTKKSNTSQKTSKSGSTTKKQKPQEEQQEIRLPESQNKTRPRRREIGAAVCLFLALFSFLGYFTTDGWFISFFRQFIGGMVGRGLYIVPPVLLMCTYILFAHRGRPVRLRLVCTLLIPLLLGAIIHLFGCRIDYSLEGSVISTLYRDGSATESACSGGLLSGLLSMCFAALFGKIGSGIVFIIVFILLIMAAFRIHPETIVEWFKTREKAEYEYIPKPEKHKKEKRYTEADVAEENAKPAAKEKPGKKPNIDIPVDEPINPPAQKPSFFNKKPAVPTPDRFFSGENRTEEDNTEISETESSVNAKEPGFSEVINKPEDTRHTESLASDNNAEPSSVTAAAHTEKYSDTSEHVTAASSAPIEKKPPQAVNTAIRPEGNVVSEPAVSEPAVPTPVYKPAPAPVRPVAAVTTEEEVRALEAEHALDKKAEKLRNEAEMKAASEEIAKELAESLGSSDPAPYEAYSYPPTELLSPAPPSSGNDGAAEVRMNAQRLESTIRSFGINASLRDVTRGPSVTRYEVELEQGVKLSRLTNLSDDIALALGATGVRIAPIPDKISIVGIEVPNKSVNVVALREIIESEQFTGKASKISFAVGKDIAGKPIVGDISKLPHMLIAGTTGSGKSVCMNSLIISLLYKASPDEVKLIMVDPKMIELGVYNGIPHLMIPVVTDPKKAAGALQWAVVEMMKRYKLFSEVGARDLATYNAAIVKKEGGKTLPQIVILIDELADLMLVAAKDVEESICRVAQMGRASGMHLVIATQRPSADVITGLMKANIPSRIAFAVDSSLNSRIILDTTGAEKLVGKGDMLYFPLGSGKPQRVQGTFVTDEEREEIVNFVKERSTAQYSEAVMQEIEQNAAKAAKDSKKETKEAKEAKEPEPAPEASDEVDELYAAAVEVVLDSKQASVSMLQRRLKLGYSRAARLVDQMEERGIVGPFEGSKPRQLLITKEKWNEICGGSGDVIPTVPEDNYLPEADEDTPEEY